MYKFEYDAQNRIVKAHRYGNDKLPETQAVMN